MIGMTRVGGAAVSGHGQAVFAAKKYDFDAGAFDEQLYLVDLTAAAARPEAEKHMHGHVLQLTGTRQKKNNGPQFSPDGEHVAFLSNRTGSMQVFVLPVRGGVGEAQQLTDLPCSVGDLVWHPSGAMYFAASVYVDGEPAADPLQATVDRDNKLKDSKTNAVCYSSLPVRQWDRWLDAKMNHVFAVQPVRDGSGYSLRDPPRDLLAGLPCECPVPPFGGAEDFSASATHFATSMRPPLSDDEAWSTNRHIYFREIGAAGPGECLTEANLGYDLAPSFSPDGQQLAWLSMETPQCEADAQRIKVRGADGVMRTLAADWDYSPDGLAWSRDGSRLLFSASVRARSAICAVDTTSGVVTLLVEDGSNHFCGEMPSGHIVYTRGSLSSPDELWMCDADGGNQVQLTYFNRSQLSELTLGEPRELFFAGAKGEQVQAWFVLPSGVKDTADLAAKSVPLAVVIHGGPQGAVSDGWHYRWNLQTYAAAGFAAIAINFHGSCGFGHSFQRCISGDWGGAPFEDIIAGCKYALAENPWLDPGRVCGLGASYGGYMINWLNGNAPPNFFKCLVNHDGLFSFEASYYSTEELFFMEFEFGGVPWKAGEQSPYRTMSPHLKVAEWKTPTLVIHGAKDYRIAETEGIATFQALKRQGIPSELLIFEAENHWVLNPLNSIIWHEKVLAWLGHWAGSTVSFL